MAAIRRLVLLINIILLFCIFTSGCYGKRELDDMAYVVGIGIGKGKGNLLKITLQTAVPLKMANGDGDAEGSYFAETVEAPTIYSALDILEGVFNRGIDLSHARVVVFSRELAQEGVQPVMNEILGGHDFRPSMYVIVSESAADEYFESIKLNLETNPAKYHQLSHQGYLYTSNGAGTTLYDFHTKSVSRHIQAVSALAEEFPNVDEGMQMAGLAIFNGTKMVGQLNREEAVYYSITKGEYGNSYFSILDSLNNDNFTVLRLSQDKRPQYKVEIQNNKLSISLDVVLEADIVALDGYAQAGDLNKLNIIEKKAENHIKEGIIRYLNRTKELETDINGFGNHVRRDFYTWAEWEKFNWLGKYKEASFNVHVSVKIRRPSVMMQSNIDRYNE